MLDDMVSRIENLTGAAHSSNEGAGSGIVPQ